LEDAIKNCENCYASKGLSSRRHGKQCPNKKDGDCNGWKSRPNSISPEDALTVANRMGILMTKPTVIKYVKKLGMGGQIGGKGGRWQINTEKWEAFLKESLMNASSGSTRSTAYTDPHT
jgi:hypothetical protein